MQSESAGIGDIKSQERGSGARFNNGKPPLHLIPFRILAEAYAGPGTPANLDALAALEHLGAWQEGGVASDLLRVLQRLGAEGWAECAHVFDYGRKKYVEWNWAKGMPWSAPLACAGRHLIAMVNGEDIDPESGLPHRGHVFCNIVMLLSYHRIYQEGDDRPVKWFRQAALAA